MTGGGAAARGRVFTATEVIGHRGLGRGTVDGLRENTAESFAAAAKAGADWIEVDVRRAADDVLVVNHDPALPDGRVIVDLPSALCREAGLITLEEALEAVPPEVGVDVDVKSVMEDAVDPGHRRTMALLAPVLRREAGRRRLFVCSFDPAALLYVHEHAPGVPTAWMPFVRNPLDQAVAGAAGLGCAIVAVDARSFGLAGEEPRPGRREVGYTVEVAHRAGLEVVSWCPGPVDAARFAEAGVDAVVVDDVPGAIAALR
ncbi:glycerophosphodiester phosphodiesterase [Streptomonospora nanhaiensis]|uniref:Glycerophosphoryl diester phosphodiesterase n=1 Tax=Streptomonospora nanhaiensis TaxID=1323731 RepID=A0A853BSM0_9ACTN|nr:glycerophosphodiester phosphodiesterase [Streptomonospora nanhaiensis]MBV2367086.1 glycerophosphodiester phosphodiesterase [Streptomonospora nanhaiensis]MBX9391285.1 glycerophosphodiester phosphodiesterase [Streptomonospora nanhaiensis]NYI97725.1 glycerophosphoryl diester phosphodiesterase [Streptomonospora nanhaiensis]